MARSAWIDLLDPDEAELRTNLPDDLRPDALRELLRPADPGGGNFRPSIRSHGDYVFGLRRAPVAEPEEYGVFFQEVIFVLTSKGIVTIPRTPGADPPLAPEAVQHRCD